MSTLDPFPARIVRAEWAEHVVSPMHDALSLGGEAKGAVMKNEGGAWVSSSI